MTLHSVSLFLLVSYTPPAVPLSLITLPPIPCPSQPANQPAGECPSSFSLSLPHLCLVFSLSLYFFLSPCPHCSPSLSNAVTTSPAVPPRLFIANRGWWCWWCWEVGHLGPCWSTHTHIHTLFLTFKYLHTPIDMLKPSILLHEGTI